MRNLRYQKLKRRGNISNQLDRWTVGIVDICWQCTQVHNGPFIALIPNRGPVFHWIIPYRDHQIACSKDSKTTEEIHRDRSGSLKCSDYRQLSTFDQFMNGSCVLRFTCQQAEQDHRPLRLIDKTRSSLDSSRVCRTGARVDRRGENLALGGCRHDVHRQTHKGRSWAIGLGAAKRICHYLGDGFW